MEIKMSFTERKQTVEVISNCEMKKNKIKSRNDQFRIIMPLRNFTQWHWLVKTSYIFLTNYLYSILCFTRINLVLSL